MMILLFPPPLCQTFFCVLLRTLSFLFHSFPFFLRKKKQKKKEKKRRGLEMTFSPNSFSFFLFSRHTSITTREEDGATNRILQNARRERERERKRDKAFDHGRRRKGQTMADDDERMPPRGRQFRNDTMNDGGKNVGKKYKDADDDDDRNGWKKKKKHRGGKNTSLSLEAFARAGKSTYDKREVLKKRRAEMAAKINKFRKVLKKAGEFVEPTKGFDPEEYAKKLTKMEDPIGNTAFVEREKMEEYVGKKVLRDDDDDDDDDRKKNKKQEEGEEDDEDDTPPEEHRGVSGKKKNKQKERPRTAHEWKMLKAQPERDRIKKEREEREKKFQEVQKIRDAKRKERGKLRHSMMKVNRKGQPLMKNRIDAILAKLEKK